MHLTELKDELQHGRYIIYELKGENINDAASLFAEVRKALPQNPPLSGRVNWDAFVDSVWGGLDDLGEAKVAVVWTRVENMLGGGLPDLVMAVECFRDLARSVCDPQTNISVPVNLTIFLVGKGPNFATPA